MSTVRVSRELLIGDTGATSSSLPPVVAGLRKASYIALGSTFLVLAIVGVVVPGLPATPFLLLASHFLVRSSPRLHGRMLRSRVIGTLLLDWQKHRGVRRKVKVSAVIVVLIAMSSSIACGSFSALALSLVLFAAATGLVVVLFLPVVDRVQPPE